VWEAVVSLRDCHASTLKTKTLSSIKAGIMPSKN
jgi:hypothetical protein